MAHWMTRGVWLVGLAALLVMGTGRAAGQVAVFAHVEPVLLTPEEVAAFHRIFEATEEQREAVQALLGAGNARIREGQEKAAAIVEEYRKVSEDQRTSKAREELAAKLEAAEPDVDALREDLLRDMRAVLTETQDARWVKFEMFRRRERVLYGPTGWNRDVTNVLALVAEAGVERESGSVLDDLLEQYEREHDRTLKELESAEEDLNAQLAGARTTGEDAQEVIRKAEFWQVAKRLKQLNFGYIGRIAGLLPEDRRAEFRRLYDMVSLREALGPDQGDLGIRAAPELERLDEETRANVRPIVREYARRYDELTMQIAEMERSRRPDGNEKVDMSRWDPVRMERGQLVSATQGKIKELLTEEQFSAMLHEGDMREKEWREKMAR
jgi:hypothetical protein